MGQRGRDRASGALDVNVSSRAIGVRLHAVVADWGVDQDVLDTVELVLSELVTNALRARAPRDRQVGIGKTTRAELKAAALKAPDIVAAPAGRQSAAVTLQPGDQVKLREAWRTVRGIRGERSASGGFVMVVGLDDGPALRVDAAEPLTVRSAGRHGQWGAAGDGER